MSTLFNMIRDINGYNGFGLPFSVDNKSTTLLAGFEQNFTVPSNFENWILIFSFSPGSSVWVANNVTASTPGVSFSDTLSELNPSARGVKGGDVISFVTSDTSVEIGVSLY